MSKTRAGDAASLGRDDARDLLALPAPHRRLRAGARNESRLHTAQKVRILQGIDDKHGTLALRFVFKNRSGQA